jgi:hypothetical protein
VIDAERSRSHAARVPLAAALRRQWFFKKLASEAPRQAPPGAFHVGFFLLATINQASKRRKSRS